MRRTIAPKGLALERAYEAEHGKRLPYWQIALDLYEDTGSCHRVAERLANRYGVRVWAKTASEWINLGLANRAAADAARAAGVEVEDDPSEVAA